MIVPPTKLFIEKQGETIHPSLAKLLARTDRINQRTKLWFTTRTRMITCSDMAAVLGQSPYNKPIDVFRKKTGQSRPFKGNYATRRGQELESVALEKYVLKTRKKVWPEDCGLLQHPHWHQIGGSPDGITLDGVVIEIKCPSSRVIIPGVCPEVYEAQVQVLMEIADMEVAHFVQYKPGSLFCEEILDITVVERDRGFFARALPILLDFMKDVTDFYTQRKLPIGTPMIDWSTDDPVALREAQNKVKLGVCKICTFAGDVLVVEEYQGLDKPVIRTEHIVSATGDGVDESSKQLLARCRKLIEYRSKQASSIKVLTDMLANQDSLVAGALTNALESDELPSGDSSGSDSERECTRVSDGRGSTKRRKCGMVD